MTSQMAINATIRAEMAAQNITQTSLAEFLGFANRRTVIDRLNGSCDWDMSEIIKVAQFLGFQNLTDFIQLAEEREKRTK